jgi:hypothetical protein
MLDPDELSEGGNSEMFGLQLLLCSELKLPAALAD